MKNNPTLRAAVADLAALYPYGALMADTTPVIFLQTVAADIKSLRAAAPALVWRPAPTAAQVERMRGKGTWLLRSGKQTFNAYTRLELAGFINQATETVVLLDADGQPVADWGTP